MSSKEEAKLFLDFDLPKELIAERPAEGRFSSRLLVEDCRELRFSEITSQFEAEDLLVLNNTKVRAARFFVRRPETKREFEFFLLEKIRGSSQSEQWLALAKPLKKLQAGEKFLLGDTLEVIIVERREDKILVELNSLVANSVADCLEKTLLMPIPPYVRSGRADNKDKEDYQTVYAERLGSVAAPTAGLHFTEEILSELRNKGVDIQFLTHHVGVGSFSPIMNGNYRAHEMQSESFAIEDELVEAVKRARRLTAVGTTTTRALESAALAGLFGGESNMDLKRNGELYSTDLFITPGFNFQMVDRLITNFHQPRSTHLLLVNAFAGSEEIKQRYTFALENKFRFFSYGDSMLLSQRKSSKHISFKEIPLNLLK